MIFVILVSIKRRKCRKLEVGVLVRKGKHDHEKERFGGWVVSELHGDFITKSEKYTMPLQKEKIYIYIFQTTSLSLKFLQRIGNLIISKFQNTNEFIVLDSKSIISLSLSKIFAKNWKFNNCQVSEYK